MKHRAHSIRLWGEELLIPGPQRLEIDPLSNVVKMMVYARVSSAVLDQVHRGPRQFINGNYNCSITFNDRSHRCETVVIHQLHRIMNKVLQDLNCSLRATLDRLKADGGFESVLHDTERLPELAVSQSASEALDLLSELRLLLEPGQLVLADHFLGISPIYKLLSTCSYRRLHENKMPMRGCRARHTRHPRIWAEIVTNYSRVDRL